MAASRAFALDVPLSAPTAGAAIDVARFKDLMIQVQGTGWVATLQMQGRLRGGAFEDIGAAVTAANIGNLIAISENVEEIRVNTTVFTSGVPAIRLHADREPD